MKKYYSTLVLFLALVFLGVSFLPEKNADGYDLNTFGQLPVVHGGRVKPLDSVARNALLLLSGKQTLRDHGQQIRAIRWLLNMFFDPTLADSQSVFEIDNPDVLGMFRIQQTSRRLFSFNDLRPFLPDFQAQINQIDQIKSEQRSPFQRALMALFNRLMLYQRLENTIGLRALDQVPEFIALPPQNENDKWITLGEGLVHAQRTGELHQGIWAYAHMEEAFRSSKAEQFNKVVQDYSNWIDRGSSEIRGHTRSEFIFNRVQPFYRTLVLYGVIVLLVFLFRLFSPQTYSRAAFQLLMLTFVVHTAALAARMIIQGRPPVTNLYSSAIFVGWVAILLGIFLETLYKNEMGTLVSGVIGFLTLLIAHHLSIQGDTMEMMRAVLDSNFWLATHVVCVTVGYASTFLAGFIATVYIFRSFFTKNLTKEQARSLVSMTYGVVCFATFFSFVGTMLGGIWADQSWGRFWGWDPKENGALMIVLWNVMILHARWGGFVKDRGLIVMAVFGNVVTSLSWFGVNMLGIGLHSYGFMDKAFWWLAAFIISQTLIMALGMRMNLHSKTTRP